MIPVYRHLFNVATFETQMEEKPEGLYHPFKRVALDQRCHKLIKIQVTCHYNHVGYLVPTNLSLVIKVAY